MPDPRLLQLLGLIVVINVLHLFDHILRGDFHWPIDGQSISFIVASSIILGGIGLGMRLYRSGRVGPRFWTIVGLLGLGLGWLSHFSPGTDQPVSVIYRAYTLPWVGALAVGCLFLLMLTVLATTIYAGSLWIRRVSSSSLRA
jgi:hypothetical protein